MSGVWGWFGGGAGGGAKKKNEAKDAILGLRVQLDMLQKREKHIQTLMDEQDAIARKNVTTNKNAAKAALRRKKGHEHSMEQTISQITTIESQINAIESANINHETLLAMEKASKAMKGIHGKLTVEKVDQTMEDLREQNALSEEIVNAISTGQSDNIIDEDLEDELEQMQQEALDEQMIGTGSVPVSDVVHRMPAVSNGPSKEPIFCVPSVVREADKDLAVKGKETAVEDDEEAELRKLQAEMAM
ncbi:snf7 family protein [Colletotrichum plurivorum]|uniref:Vacuolar-sorting protein SNF7 n=1 Tax=Colletotrichum plurivorum TaxID=2175906 RepID=A0A8H6NGH2_9PEZI|nr:snf7 family protein [Colletotrichum plurivorum]